MISYFSRVADCRDCPLKPRCCPNSPSRKITRHIHEAARDVARAIAKTAAYEQTRRDRKKVEMLFAHLKRIRALAACDCADPPARSSSSQWRQSPRTFAVSPS